MKIQKVYRASLLALTVLFVWPISLLAADGKWDRMLEALHHDRAAVSHLSKQDRAILEVTMLLKAHRPDQAMRILEAQPENPLIKQLKVQAAREHLVEVVRRAGGTRSEVKLPAPSAGLIKALAEADARLNTFVRNLAAVKKEAVGQAMQLEARNRDSVSPAHSEVQDISQTFLEQMTPARRWAYLLDVLEHKRLRMSKHLSKQDQAVLIAAVLLKAGQPAQALNVLAAQPSTDIIKQLRSKATRERTIQAVIRAGGSRSEVRLPAESTAMTDALASVDARLQAFMHQLNQEKAKPAKAVRHSVRVAKKAAAGIKGSNQHSQPVIEKRASDVRAAADSRPPVANASPPVVSDAAGDIAMPEADQPLSPAVRDAVLQAVEAWRAAWSNRDLDAYFAAYADDFDVTDRFASMAAWQAYKRWVIGKRSAIAVTLDNIQVAALPDGQVRVEFLQHFRADAYQTDDLKVLRLKHAGGGWAIVREASMTKPD